MGDQISITLPDGSTRPIGLGATAADLAAAIGPRLAKDAVIAVVNGAERDLDWVLRDGDAVELILPASDRGRYTLRHSSAHVLAQAVLAEFPGATFGIGPPIEDGFYYDFELPGGETFTPEDLDRVDARMRAIIAERQPFVRSEVPQGVAAEKFADHKYKLEIIGGKADDPTSGTEAGMVRLYDNPPAFCDVCRGPHVPHTGRLGHFRLMRVAGAYWRGDERNPMLQRIYGTAWESKAALEEHLHRLEEAERRDHRRLAVELDLLSFPSELGGGLAVWHPKGATVRRLMEDYSRARHERAGYEFVYTPHLANAQLFQTSGHLDFYKDGMYPAMEMDNGSYYPKPMNCPMHCLIYRSRQRSYRELPLRLFELGTVYRYERAGTLHGLLRTRGFTQDDAHIFCTEDQAAAEVKSLLAFVMSVLRAFGFHEFEAMLATRDPDKSVGAEERWVAATDFLRQALEDAGLPYRVDEGGAAFYGPKIDLKVRDAIGRPWQLSTIQYDFNLPERFDLEYVGSDNARHRPVMLHRALLGSLERFFGVLVEHYAGAFPAWLAPVQVRVLPVSDAHQDYALSVVERLRAAGLRTDLVEASEGLGRRIRSAKLEKLPYVLVTGDDDVAHGTVGVNPRGGEVERDVALEDFVRRLTAEAVPGTGS